MHTRYPIAAVGELIGEPSRAAILVTLLEGTAQTAGELAFAANVSPQSASAHLSKLVDGGLLTVRSSGRQRYYRLAGPEVARAIEALGSIATRSHATAASRRRIDEDMYTARSCYDHLAGRIAVELATKLEGSDVVRPKGEREYELGQQGRDWFGGLGIDVAELRRSRRVFAFRCVDWTERRPHLAGALGAALFSRLIELGWIARHRGRRAMRIMPAGARELRAHLGIVT